MDSKYPPTLKNQVAPSEVELAETLPSERARLVRLCARATGDPDAAEDLAQEALFEAWRSAHKLPAGVSADERGRWLSGIARNVCLRWAPRRGREFSHRVFLPSTAEADTASDAIGNALDLVPDDFELDVELERSELGALLDRAMGLLPPETRRVLYEQVVTESPLAETALRLGLSQGAVAMRLQRGKLALRRILTTEFLREAVDLGLIDGATGATAAWQETRLWCQVCGQRRLLGHLSPNRHEFWLRCPACGNYNHSDHAPSAGLVWNDLKGLRPILWRHMAWMDGRFREALRTRAYPCVSCGRIRRPWLERRPGDDPYAVDVRTLCGACGTHSLTFHAWLALCLPEGRRFYREQQRIRYAGHRGVHVGPAGGPALITSYESVKGGARLDVVSVWDTFEVLGVYGAGAMRGELATASWAEAPNSTRVTS